MTPSSPLTPSPLGPTDLLACARQLLDSADGEHCDGLKTVWVEDCDALEAAVHRETARRIALGARLTDALTALHRSAEALIPLAESLERWRTAPTDKRAAAQLLRALADTRAFPRPPVRSPGLHPPVASADARPEGREPIECRSLFVVSTAHIEREDAQLLEHAPAELPFDNTLFIANTTFGFLLYIGDEGPGELPEGQERFGYSRAFAQLLTRVYQSCQGSCYLMLDGDVPCIPGLPIYSW